MFNENNLYQKNLDEFNESADNAKQAEDIKKVFEFNPELINIGTKQQYGEYIKTIFPESKIKYIVWRNDTSVENVIDTEAITPSGEKRGRFFGTFNEVQNHGGYTKIMFPVLLNLKNPKQFNSSQKLEYYYTKDNEKIIEAGYDGIESKTYDTKEPYEYVAYYQNQIYILGSAQDLEKFREFVQEKNGS